MKYDENFNLVVWYTFGSEGGYVNDKDDAGGPTNMGITQDTYDSWNARQKKPKKDIRDITREEATEILYYDYWLPSGADKIEDIGMAYVVFDTEMNAGHGTNAKIRKNARDNTIDAYLDAKRAHHEQYIKEHPEKKKFESGWENRILKMKKDVVKVREAKRIREEFLKTFSTKYSGNNAIEKMNEKTFKSNEEDINKELETRFKMIDEYNKKIKKLKTSSASSDSPSLNTKDKSNEFKLYYSGPPESFVNLDGITWDGKKFKDWKPEEQKAFLEGYFGETLESIDKKREEKNKWTNKFNIGNPNTDKGHWITLDNGKHLFIKDKKVS